jgi:hypothetical protein
MARRTVDPETLESEIAQLGDLDITELRKRWQKHYGRPAPKTFRCNLLIRGLAYQMRVEVYGGLSPATKRRLREIAEAVRTGNEEAVLAGPRIKPGTQLYRAWQDKTHRVNVLNDGFEWQGSWYQSLSAVAKAITGTNWNGYAFFGLKRRPLKNKNALKAREATDA